MKITSSNCRTTCRSRAKRKHNTIMMMHSIHTLLSSQRERIAKEKEANEKKLEECIQKKSECESMKENALRDIEVSSMYNVMTTASWLGTIRFFLVHLPPLRMRFPSSLHNFISFEPA